MSKDTNLEKLDNKINVNSILLTKGILKNVSKFNNIKLAKGLDISLYATKRRSVNGNRTVGISTATYGNKWFVTPKGRAIFKTYDDEYGEEIRNVRIVNELLCKELCNQIGLDCAEYELAYKGKNNGLLSYDIAGNNKIINFEEFLSIDKTLRPNILDCAKAIDIYKDKGFNINKKEIIIALYKTILFDTLTLQTDRNVGNINFIYDKNNKKFTPAKIIDNEFAFYGEGVAAYANRKQPVTMSIQELISEHSTFSRMLTFDGSYILDRYCFKNNISDLTFYAKKHTALMKVLDSCLNNIDPETAIRKVESLGVKVNEEYKKYVCDVVYNIKQLILLQKSKKIKKEELDVVEKIY